MSRVAASITPVGIVCERVGADLAPERVLDQERTSADQHRQARGFGLRAQLADQLGDGADVEGHGRRQRDQSRWVAGKRAQQIGARRVGAQVVAVPAAHFEKVGDHAQAEFVQVALDAATHRARPGAGTGGGELREEAVHQGHRRGGGEVLVGDADAVQLPQPPDLALRALEHVEVQALQRQAVARHRGRDQVGGGAALAQQQQIQELLRQRVVWLVAGDE